MHGDHPYRPLPAVSPYGSSPHARGPRERIVPLAGHIRFIPACTGTTEWVCTRLELQTVHPRMHGDHISWERQPGRSLGSSPHARGPRISGKQVETGARFIPACTGTTSLCYRCHVLFPVHPRMHGDHRSRTTARTAATGSSPHARGPLKQYSSPFYRTRFIPACTGTTRFSNVSPGTGTVHPRMHGDHVEDTGTVASAAGSSPHARGPRSGL